MPAYNPAETRILVVDDVETNRGLLIRRLERLGIGHIEWAADGREALTKIAAGRFDAVLLDVMMPNLSGPDTLAVLRDENRLEETPVIMISANTEIDIVVRCLELGAEDYLPKPFNPVLLQARLGSVLEKKALRAQLRRQLTRMESELAEARKQQLSMLPTTFPGPVGAVGASVHALMRPAREVGGDLFDAFMLDDAALCVAVGDVSDKGVPAALFMARARSLLRATGLQLYRREGRVPCASDVVAVMNEELGKNNPFSMFVTLFLGFIDLETGILRYVNAGHLRPYILDPDGTVRQLVGTPDVPVGVIDDYAHREDNYRLKAGEGLVVISDGLSDAVDGTGRTFTLDRVAEELGQWAGASGVRPAAITAGLLSSNAAFVGATPAVDDITVLAVTLAS